MAENEEDGFTDEFEQRLQNLEARAGAAKTQRETLQKQEDQRISNDAKSAVGMGVGLTVAYAILGTPLLGAGVGWFIDRQLGSNVFMGIATLIGACGGVAFAVVFVNRNSSRL